MPFHTALTVEKVPYKRKWIVKEEFVYYSEEQKQRIVVNVPYKTDFASIPRIFWTLIGPPGGLYTEASVIHDYIYTNLTHRFTKKEADEVFLEAMKELGVGWFRRNIMFAAVRVGGSGNW